MNAKAMSVLTVLTMSLTVLAGVCWISDVSDAESFTEEWKYAPLEDKTLNVTVGDTVTLKFTSAGYNGTYMRYTVQDKPAWLAQSGTANSPILSGSPTSAGTYYAHVLMERVQNSSVTATQTITVTMNVASAYSSHTIAYSANGGAGSMANTTVTDTNSYSNVTLAANGFNRAGYTFAGWNVNGTVYQPGQQISVGPNATVTATAVWSENTLTASANNIAGVSGHSYTNQISAVANNGATFTYAVKSCSAGTASVNGNGLVTFNAPSVSNETDVNVVITVTAQYPDGQTKSVDAAFSVMVDPILTFTNSATNGTLSIKGA